MRGSYRRHTAAADYDHKTWLSLIEVSGPFLSIPVLRQTWPTLDPLDKPERERLRARHADWLTDQAAGRLAWCDYVLGELLGWGDALHRTGLDDLAVTVAEHDTVLTPDFVLVHPGEEIKPDTVRVLGMTCPAGSRPTARVKDSTWAATPADRLAQMCRHHEIELGLATDGRFWTLVWAPRGGATTMATFDTVAWPEAAERDVVRAFRSLLHRHRFFAVPDDEKLVPLLRRSLDNQEEITEALGVQVRQAVELLVAAFGRIDVRDRELSGRGLQDVDAHEVYRGAVSVMMRIVFLLFAEERRLLPADNELYATAYSAGRLCAELEQRVTEGSEEDLEHSTAAWQRLIALFNAVYHGVYHPRLTMHGHDGSLFDPQGMPWLPLNVDDRTVLHMLRAVQFVQIGRGAKTSERRTVSFRTLDVEQIGYVYEGLLSFEGFRAEDVTVGLIGKEGMEDEVRLTGLESLAEQHCDAPDLAKALAERYKDSKIGSPVAVARRLAVLQGSEREEARKRLLAVTGGDYELSRRLLPFYGLIRTDLRDLPVVVLPGALFVTESALRRNTGTHYTPRKLAEEIVEGALEPLVYKPGPLQTADTKQWKPKSSEEILTLKVADIAMGSAAFLVAAARYLGQHLLDAALREGRDWALDYQAPTLASALDTDDDPAVIEARRQIIEHCLYGVDINPMAVEMAKLSLWLVSMDSERPFTFLDDRLAAGDSLLGVTSLEQLEYLHLLPKRGRALHKDTLHNFTSGVKAVMAASASERRAIADVVGDDPAVALVRKRELLTAATARVETFCLLADLTVGAALAYASRGERATDAGAIEAAKLASDVAVGLPRQPVEAKRSQWLATDHVEGSFDRYPLHWPLIFPEVFDHGGFDAIVGNPPFLGGPKLRPALGFAYREYLSFFVANNVRATNADLVAYFTLRVHDLLNEGGQAGLIATNSLAQGDTREVGLDQLLAKGVTIRRATKSKPWPSRSAVLEYCAVWTTHVLPGRESARNVDGMTVSEITSSLDPASRVAGAPKQLASNFDLAFLGIDIGGPGFVLDSEAVDRMIDADPRNAEVLLPYVVGQDLNSRPDSSASRWVIDFHDWSEARAQTYLLPYHQVLQLVKPDRASKSEAVQRAPWWQFWRRRPALQLAKDHLDFVIVLAQVSKTLMPTIANARQIFSHMTIVFASRDTALLSFLSSAPHCCWAMRFSSTMKADLRYSPTDVFTTIPLPELTQEMRDLGEELEMRRRPAMLSRQAGLTAIYNIVFDSGSDDVDILDLRRIHRNIDNAVCRAYGWDDLVEQGLDHGFHTVGTNTRYTVGPAVQREILDRLLEINHARYAEEVAKGLHDKKSGKAKGGTQASLFGGMS